MSSDPARDDRLAAAALLALAVMLPFEIVGHTISAAGFTWTTLELTMILFLGVATVSKVQVPYFTKSSLRYKPEYRLVLVMGLWIAFALLASLLAPSHRAEALRATLRLALGPLLFWSALPLLHTSQRRERLIWALAIGGGMSAALGLLEWGQWAALDPFWRLFKEGPGRVGGLLRVSGPLPFATSAALYWELCAALAVGLAAAARQPGRRRLALGLLMLCTSATLLTFSRSGLLLLWGGAIATLGVALLRPAAGSLRRPALIWLLLLAVGTAALALGSDIFRARLSSENDLGWYRASYEVPASIEIDARQSARLQIGLTNQGSVTWQPSGDTALHLEGRWLNAAGTTVLDVPILRLPLSDPVPPAGQLTLDAELTDYPSDGDYQLAWGLAQRDQFRLHQRGSPEALTAVTVVQSPTTTPPGAIGPAFIEAAQPLTVARRDLWGAALQLWQERPLLGIGADNFRHRYGPALGMAAWDERLTANNLYLELLVDLGLIGLSLFLLLMGLVVGPLMGRISHAPAPLIVGVALALLMYLAHGIVDVFLWQNGPNAFLWLLLALAATPETGTEYRDVR